MLFYFRRVRDFLSDPFFPLSSDPLWRRPFVVAYALGFCFWSPLCCRVGAWLLSRRFCPPVVARFAIWLSRDWDVWS